MRFIQPTIVYVDHSWFAGHNTDTVVSHAVECVTVGTSHNSFSYKRQLTGSSDEEKEMWKMSSSVMTELLSVLIQVISEEGVAWMEQLSETRLPVVTVVFCGTATNTGGAECIVCMCVWIERRVSSIPGTIQCCIRIKVVIVQ